MAESFLNPITLSFELLERYKAHLRDSLLFQGLAQADVDTILDSIEVDRGLFLSINRRYRTCATGFRQFCKEHDLANELPNLLDWKTDTHLYIHQEKAILSILNDNTTIVSTGTGSGKTEAFLIPILDHCLKHPGPGVKALIIYPMNALANDQLGRIKKKTARSPVTSGLFVGSTPEQEREKIRQHPPDILITNYVMLDWMLTRSRDQTIFNMSMYSLKYIVLDEIHTYRGNKATHLRFLLNRLKDRLNERLAGPIVQIGTSATLQNNTQLDGYLADDSERRDAFIRPLLGVEEYVFVQPDYEPEPDAADGEKFFPLPSPNAELGWALDCDPQVGLENLSRLMGKNYSAMDLGLSDITRAEFYRDLERHDFVRQLRRLLIDHGAQSFVELSQLLNHMLPSSYPQHRVENLSKAYLSAIAFANHHAAGRARPVLDFRIHLFLRNVGGLLKRCIKCGKYHSGNQELCQDCGFPLLCVYRHDIRQCLGKVTGNRLRWELVPESDNRQNEYYVLVQMGEAGLLESPEGTMGFRHDIPVDKEEIVLNYDVFGRLRLRLSPMRTYKEAREQTIPLVNRTESHEYLRTLVQAILNFEPPHQKQLLGFVDSREMASRTASILQDEFASQFLEECLKKWYPPYVNLVSALKIMHRQKDGLGKLSEAERGVFDELDLWYWRYVSMLPRYFGSKQNLLRLRLPEDLSVLEMQLLEIFMAERAIAKTYEDERPDGQYIKFWKHYATDKKGIHLQPGEESKDPRYPSISLSEQAHEYQSFVRQYGHHRIMEVVKALVERGVLQLRQTPDGKNHYYLNPEVVCFDLPESKCRDYEEIHNTYLLTAAVHSSEIRSEERCKVESQFKGGGLNLVMATPTLELGIDIGELKNVLMVGVPPSPSNYAQRAGRAGRGRNDNFALIVTFCSEWEEHDIYYFQRPKLMINGVISPPSFSPRNPEIVRKHVNAFMLTGIADNRRELEIFASEIDTQIRILAPRVREVFADTIDESYLTGDFRQQFLHQYAKVEEKVKGQHQVEFYHNGFFPDYDFRSDHVYLLDTEAAMSGAAAERQLAESSLSQHEPELAYYKFSPGETVYVAGNIYTVTSRGQYETVGMDGETARSYDYLEAEKQIRYAAKRKEIRKYDRAQVFDSDSPFREMGKVLGIAYDPDCHILFLNRGCLSGQKTETFHDYEDDFCLGYELRRQALVFRFNGDVCADDRLTFSFCSVLDRTIKDKYGLDESEIRLIQATTHQDLPTRYLLIYEADGNGNVPLKDIYDNLEQVISLAHQTMSECKCDNGCYLCLRNYSTRFFAGAVDKETARMFTGYLLGKNRFQPSIPEPKVGTTEFDLVLQLCKRGGEFVVQGPRGTFSAAPTDGQNETIFNLLTQAVQAEFSEGMRRIKILATEDYIVNAINDGTAKKGKAQLARLQFNLLRFKTVVAERRQSS